MTARPASPWSHIVRVEDVPEGGLHLDLAPNEAVRAALAKLAGIVAVPRLQASLDLRRDGRGLHVTGQVTASVIQNCVVTLEPLENPVAESLDIVFVPAKLADAEGEVSHDPEVEEPEALVDGAADLGAIAAEYLLLGIDPYPRKPGVEFAAPEVKDSGINPFAALAGLKKP
jgi:uncharacterized metal-binding protein YceD (DUF177 family)